jgi:hypothetical protein
LWYAWAQSETGRAAATLPSEIEAARRIGLPTTPDELRAQTRSKKGTNAAPDYVTAFSYAKSTVRSPLSKYELQKVLDGKASATEIAAIKADIRRAKPALDLLIAGSKKDLVDYNRPWEQGFLLLFRDLTDTRNLINLLCLRAYFQPEERASLVAAVRVARQMGGDPTTISSLIQGIVERQPIDTLQRLLQDHPEDPELHRIGREILVALGPMPSMRYAFGGDLVQYRLGVQQSSPKQLEELRMSGVKLELPAGSGSLLRFPAVRRANEATMIRFWREMAERVPDDPEDIRGLRTAMGEVESRYKDPSRLDHAFIIALGLFRRNIPTSMGTALARRRVLEGTLNALEARTKTGAYPKAIGVADPFGTEMVYKPSTNGFQLYSVGPDGQDNGGKARVKDEPVYDIGVRMTHPL